MVLSEKVDVQDTEGQVDGRLDGGLDERLVEDELLVEEVSIDGMCGVY